MTYSERQEKLNTKDKILTISIVPDNGFSPLLASEKVSLTSSVLSVVTVTRVAVNCKVFLYAVASEYS